MHTASLIKVTSIRFGEVREDALGCTVELLIVSKEGDLCLNMYAATKEELQPCRVACHFPSMQPDNIGIVMNSKSYQRDEVKDSAK